MVDSAVEEALGDYYSDIYVVLRLGGAVQVTDDGRDIPVRGILNKGFANLVFHGHVEAELGRAARGRVPAIWQRRGPPLRDRGAVEPGRCTPRGNWTWRDLSRQATHPQVVRVDKAGAVGNDQYSRYESNARSKGVLSRGLLRPAGALHQPPVNAPTPRPRGRGVTWSC